MYSRNFTRTARRATLMLATAACLASSPARAASSDGIAVGLKVASTEEAVLSDWKPLLDGLAKELQQPVRVYVSKSYADIAAALSDGRVQVAWINNKLALEVVASESASIFAQMVRLDGSTGYKSVLLVRKDSPLRDLGDLLNKPVSYTLASGDPSSTSGYLVPNYYAFGKNKVDPNKHFKKVNYGNHLQNFQDLVDSTVDVATNNTEEMPRYKDQFPQRYSNVRVLWESPLIPNDPLLMRKDLPANTQLRVRKFFLSYGRTDAEKLTLKNINGLSAFRSSNNYQLRPIADIQLFDSLTKIMTAEGAASPKFKVASDELTKRASRLDSLLNASRFETP